MKEMMKKVVEKVLDFLMARKEIGIRFLYTMFFLVVFAIVKTLLDATVIVQFVYLLVARKHSEQLRQFQNKLATYVYKVIRYLSLTENRRPYPLTDFPPEMDEMEWPDILVEETKQTRDQSSESSSELKSAGQSTEPTRHTDDTDVSHE